MHKEVTAKVDGGGGYGPADATCNKQNVKGLSQTKRRLFNQS